MIILIVRIEGILNLHPLTSVSSDPNDLCALTLGHFLIEQPLMAIPESDLTDVKINRLTIWQLIKQAQQCFWKRWINEYLLILQGRQKWLRQNTNLNVGNLGIVKSPGRPLLSWQLRRLIDVHPDADEVVRVVTLKTAEGTLKRPVVKLSVS